MMQDGSTPLHMAAKNGHTAIVEALVTAGADVNVQSKVCTHSCRPPLTLSPCLPRVWVSVARGRGTVAEEAVGGTLLIRHPPDGVCVCGGGAGWEDSA